ncbi:MAG: 30S ribosomal protein S16 [Candidatus Shapirobacteria bacterium]|jgi:small subunit ribosomal protein S16
MLKIKLSIRGKKHQRTFRIVIAEAKSKVTGKVVDTIGFYTPQTKTLNLNQELYQSWIKKGAVPTLGLKHLLEPEKYPFSTPKVKAKAKNSATSTT